jgi:predicted dehydrogenase
MAKELRVGIAGLRRGKDFIPGLQACAQTELAAVCDVDAEVMERYADRFGEVKRFGDYTQMLDSGVDMVIVATPMHLHVPMSVEALGRGIHVLSEVTAATSLEQCRELLRAVRASSAKYMMAENCCYMKPYVLVKEMARAGLFGDIYYGEGDYVHEIRTAVGSGHWRGKWLFGRRGGTYTTHPLGPILYWMDDVVATVNCVGTGAHMDASLYVDDTSIMLCRTAKGGLIAIRNDMMSPRPHTHNYVALQGTKGAYEAARHAEDTHRVCLDSPEADALHRKWQSLWDFESEFLPEVWRNPPDEAIDAGHGGSDYFPVRDFVDAILKDTAPPIDVYRALDFTVPGLMSEVSVERGGAPVAVPNFRFV